MKVLKLFMISLVVLIVSATSIISCKKSMKEEQPSVSDEQKAVLGGKGYNSPHSKMGSSNTNPLVSKSVALNTTVYNTDFVTAGVGGTRNVGSGTISLSGVSGTVSKAILYWHGVTNSTIDVGNSITVNATTVTGTNIGVSSSNCWPFDNSQGYKADVTALVQSTGNGNYALSGFGDLNPNGASLLVFFNDANNLNNRDVVIFDGNDSNIDFAGIIGNPNAPADPAGWNVTLPGINYVTGTANIQLHVADGQSFPDDALVVNATTIVPAGPIFDGVSVPGANNGPDNNGNLWDIKSFDVTSLLSVGPNTLSLTTGTNADCLGLIVALIDLPAGAAPVTDITVALDFKPGGCPSPMYQSETGTVPMAILGSATFDVTKIDVATLKVAGVSPTGWAFQDVATPYAGTLTDCLSCTSLGADGYMDLTLKFSNQALVAAFSPTTLNQCLKINLTGKLKAAFGATNIKGSDIVRILKKK